MRGKIQPEESDAIAQPVRKRHAGQLEVIRVGEQSAIVYEAEGFL